MLDGDHELQELLRRAIAAQEAMSPEQRREAKRQQVRSFIRSEAGFGSDEDEAEYVQALQIRDDKTLQRLDEEAKLRVRRVEEAMDRLGY